MQLFPVSAEVNAAREIVMYAHVHPDAAVTAARALVDAYDAALSDARGEYVEESEALLAAASPFARSYVGTMAGLGASYGDGDARGEVENDSSLAPDDLHPTALRSMIAEADSWYAANAATIAAAEATGEVSRPGGASVVEMAAHDFALTRNGHGAGFWDGDWPEPMASALSDAARAAGESGLYTGDDGAIYEM